MQSFVSDVKTGASQIVADDVHVLVLCKSHRDDILVEIEIYILDRNPVGVKFRLRQFGMHP